MGAFDYMDVSTAKVEELWKSYLRSRGLSSELDPIPAGETAEQFRRNWEKFLYAQSPSGAAAAGTTTTTTTAGGTVTVTPAAARKFVPGALPADVSEQEALDAGCVLVFEHKDYRGRAFVLPPGQYPDLRDLGLDDLASSSKVPVGVVLQGYEHLNFTGDLRSFTGNVNWWDKHNDWMTSAIVKKV